MLSKLKNYFPGPAALLLVLVPGGAGMASYNEITASVSERQQHGSLHYQVHSSLLRLPNYGVFDALGIKIEGSTVTLMGQVTSPALKSEAEWAVKDIAGVKEVVNKIEILPPSPMDNDIRLRAYAAIYLNPSFERHRSQTIAPIRIIVKNGSITLIGVVDTPEEKTFAGMTLMNIPFVHSVTNQLTVR
ncbi:MAG TPA: BON domain-containing protein [Acidobacteriota bacterium]|nr:BON domain-containing protein [Acidobacteriota bacterium]